MIATITLTLAGADTGPFNLYSDLDGYTTAFETGVSKAALLAGYTTALVPDGTNIIKVLSTGLCTNAIYITLVYTTTSTTTVPDPLTSTLTFFSYENGVFTFTLSDAIYSTSFLITGATVDGSTTQPDCTLPDVDDNITVFNPISMTAGSTTGSVLGTTPFNCIVQSFSRVNYVVIDGYGIFVDGDTVVIGGTTVTISIPNTCVSPYTCSVYTQWNNVLIGDDPLTICAQTPGTVYTPFGQIITTGTIVYSDAGLTMPIVGSTYITNPTTNGIYNLGVGTGLIGTFTSTFCL